MADDGSTVETRGITAINKQLSVSVDYLQGIPVFWETTPHPDVSRQRDVVIFYGMKYPRELGCTETSGVGICTNAASCRKITEL